MRTDQPLPTPEAYEAHASWSFDELKASSTPNTFSADRIAGMSADQTRTAAILCALLLALFAAMGVWSAEIAKEQSPAALSDCSPLHDDLRRLACYDRPANSVDAPSKGGSLIGTTIDGKL